MNRYRTVRTMRASRTLPLLLAVMVLVNNFASAQQPNVQDVRGSVITGYGAQPIYTEPDNSSRVINYLGEGTPLTIHARTADDVWLYVTAAASEALPEITGWMWRSLVTTTADLTLLQIFAPPPETVLETMLIYNVLPFAREIYRYGQSIGNRANFFSKVGDSITVSTNFLTPFGLGAYDLGEYIHLEPIITYFNSGADNAFAYRPIAAQTSWTTANLLKPYEITTGSCNRGETPLACEYRVHKPAFALIMIGTNDSVTLSTDVYRENLAEVIAVTIDRGIIPVLSTIPSLGRDPDRARFYNLIIIDLATQYRIPLMNYWLAMRNLPDMGLTFDGVHPSSPPFEGGAAAFTPANLQYGYTVRNLLALEMLDVLVRTVTLEQ